MVHSKPFQIAVPCGQCSECRSLKVSSYKLRAYYHAKETLEKFPSSFVLFDTLTYNDYYLPHLSDHTPYAYGHRDNISCFNRRHLQLFFKRLRQKLVRDGYNVANNLDYFLTSEFGNEDEYIYNGQLRKHTRRPHYHVLFFVKFNIDPLVFSKYVSLAWIYGRTDGVDYKGVNYVMTKRVFKSFNPLFLSIIGYVAKYATKQFSYSKKIGSAIRNVMFDRYCGNVEFFNTFEGRKEFLKLKRESSPFLLTSHGFGKYLLECFSVDYLVENNSAPIYINNNRTIVNIPLPNYYKRKLFYSKIYFNGSYTWIPNDLGIKYLKGVTQKNIDNYIKRLKSLSSIIDNYISNAVEVKFTLKKLGFDDNLKALAEYVFLYRGRILVNGLVNGLDSLDRSSYCFDGLRNFGLLLYPYNTVYDSFRFGRKIVSFKYLGSSFVTRHIIEDKFSRFRNEFILDDSVLDSKVFAGQYCYYDSYFEVLLDYINSIFVLYNTFRDNKQIKLELQRERYQDIGMVK